MKPTVLTLRQTPPGRVDASPLRPDACGALSREALCRVSLSVGRETVSVRDLFTVEAGDPGHLVIRDETGAGRLDSVGAGLRSGRLSYYGVAGAFLGRDLRGGEIDVHGQTGNWAGSDMRGGLIQIYGNAGDFLGGPGTGEMKGIRGGTIVVHGHAGQRAGDRMRRGMLLIAGDAGDYCASRMIAGTVVVLGQAGRHLGYAMRRGSVLLPTGDALIATTFADCGESDFHFLVLLARHCATLGFPLPAARRARRFMGDRANDGKGEILLFR